VGPRRGRQLLGHRGGGRPHHPPRDGRSAPVAAAQRVGAGRPSPSPAPPLPAPLRVVALAAGARGNVWSSHPPGRRVVHHSCRGGESAGHLAAASAAAGRRRRQLPLGATWDACGAAVWRCDPPWARSTLCGKGGKSLRSGMQGAPGSPQPLATVSARWGGEKGPHRPCACRCPLIISLLTAAVGIACRPALVATGGHLWRVFHLRDGSMRAVCAPIYASVPRARQRYSAGQAWVADGRSHVSPGLFILATQSKL